MLTLVILVQGCYAAILHPSQLPSGKGVSSAVNSVLCQFSVLETEADDMLVRASSTVASRHSCKQVARSNMNNGKSYQMQPCSAMHWTTDNTIMSICTYMSASPPAALDACTHARSTHPSSASTCQNAIVSHETCIHLEGAESQYSIHCLVRRAPAKQHCKYSTSALTRYHSDQTTIAACQALLAWYQDILADPASNRVSPARPPATPFGKLQLTTPVKTTRSTAAAAAAAAANSEVSPEGSVTSPLAKMGINTPTAKGKGDKPEAKQVCADAPP